MLNLMNSYLTNREQYVKFHLHKSYLYKTDSGVPQGSNLGPLLFLIYINDLPNVIQYSKCLLFADDLKIYKSIENENDSNKLQADINNVYRWSVENDLFFNIKKCCFITYTRNKAYLRTSYSMNNESLERVYFVKDLGVTIQHNLTYHKHIFNITNDALKNLGFIIRNSKNFNNTSSLILLFNCLVRARLEYASVIWSPHCISLSNQIEKIQKRFSRYLYYKKFNQSAYEVAYTILVKEFNLTTLANRRVFAEQLFLFKIVNGLSDSSELLSQLSFNARVSNLRGRELLYFNKPNTTSHKYSPLLRMSSKFNEFSRVWDLDFSFSLLKYKQNLNKILNDH